MRLLCWIILAISATATGVGCWAAWHYQSVWFAIAASHGCVVIYQAVRAVIEAHRLTCAACEQWQSELTASGYCERCFWGSFEGAKNER